jgi:DNA-binding HxlR family transcriptional regulator
MFAVVILLAMIYVSSRIAKINVKPDPVEEIMRDVREYAHINGILYREFNSNLHMAVEFKGHVDISHKLLERAIHNLEELGMYSKNEEIMSKLNAVIERLHNLKM